MKASDRRRVQALAGVLAGDVVFDVVADEWVHEDLERLRVPQSALPVILAAKSAAAAGLLVGLRRRPVGELASACLVGYFVLAIGAHARARDEAWRYWAAVGMLTASVRVLQAFRHARG